ncbi:MAG: hypothetical protein M8841_04100 [marine benthic group bacterium]|jgi:hypothetical protein|nr:hypothetical protein [Gemmatimonadota bacterium]MCL7966330.1 hypothetical protein [Gemmatimonadota bacterium]MCL7974705.1 hypothetical protein [Gemmatimonadota bacterium]
MLRNRTLPIVALLAGAMMFGACAEEVAGPGPGQAVEPAVASDNGGLDYTADLPEDAEVHSPDGEWTEPHKPGKKAAE